MRKFSGIYPMQYAFFNAQNKLDRDAMRRQANASVAMGAHGVAALGLGTEVSKLTESERRDVMHWLTQDVAGRVPIAITVFGATTEQQINTVKAAAALGVNWVILQPPVHEPIDEPQLIRFFGAVMDQSPIPVAIQNAPQYLGVGLSDEGIRTLARNHANFTLLKGESSAMQIHQTIQAVDGALDVFNGRGGLELTDNLRAGCAGMIPASDCADIQIQIYQLMQAGKEDEAEALYQQVLPLITFVMQSIDQFLCYGKRITAQRLGLSEVFDREPGMQPSEFGVQSLARYSQMLGPLND
jgi:4-hydroxy-tetrahydrodipicolinate synthase